MQNVTVLDLISYALSCICSLSRTLSKAILFLLNL